MAQAMESIEPSLEEAVKFYKEKGFFKFSTGPTTTEGNIPTRKELNYQTCSRCLNYLSFGPNKISNDENNKDTSTKITLCARENCTPGNRHSFQPWMEHNQTLYFPCINSYSGCNVILRFSGEMKKHEAKCEYAKVFFACEECSFTGNGCQIIQHYKRSHSDLFAEDGVLKVKVNSNSVEIHNILYPTEHSLLMITLEISDTILKISGFIINSAKIRADLYVIFFSPETETDIRYVTKCIKLGKEKHTIEVSLMKKYLESNIFFGAIQLNEEEIKHYESTKVSKVIPVIKSTEIPVIKLIDNTFTKTFKKILEILSKIEFTCSNCKILINNQKDILMCPQSHFSCIYCSTSYCKLCQTECSLINIRTLFVNFTLFCDWKNCNKRLHWQDFLTHKQICCSREYKCPLEDCAFVGSSQELQNHWHSIESPLKFGTVLDFIKKNNNFYWIIDDLKEMLHVKLVNRGFFYFLEIYETTAVMPKSYTLELWCYSDQHKCFFKFENLIQTGIIKTQSNSFHQYSLLRLVMKTCNSSLISDIPDTSNLTTKTSEDVLKELVNIFFRITPKCSNCNGLIKDKADINFCNKSDIACNHCAVSKCSKCKMDNVQFINLNSLLKDLKFSCDWSGCNEKTNCWDFLKHKQICIMRQYRCPLPHVEKDDIFVGTKEKLEQHWHFNQKLENDVNLHYDVEKTSKTLYWITGNFQELLIVDIKVNTTYYNLEVNESFAVFPNDYKITLYYYNATWSRYEKLEDLKQVGIVKKSTNIMSSHKKYKISIEKLYP